MAHQPGTIYLCHEPEQAFLARRIDGWDRTDPDSTDYAARADHLPNGDDAGPIQAQLVSAIQAADVFVCLISQTAATCPWLAWEIRTARACTPPRPLVGIMTNEYHEHPPDLADAGAIFVPFKRDTVDRGIRWAFEMKATNDDFTIKDF
jgi:hypothetical protein